MTPDVSVPREPPTDPTLFRYVGLGSSFPALPAPEPSEPEMPDTKTEEILASQREMVALLRQQETRNASAVTHADLQTLGDTVVREVGSIRTEMRAESAAIREEVKGVQARVTVLEARPLSMHPARRMSPMPPFDPEKTEGGSRMVLTREKWAEIEETIEAHSIALAAAKQAEHDAQERQGAVQAYANKQAVWLKRILWAAGPILTAAGTAIHYGLAYLEAHYK